MNVRKRLRVACAFCLLPVLPLVFQLFKFEILENSTLSVKANREFSRAYWEIAPRAPITDRNGNILAESLPVWRIFADRKMVLNPTDLALKIAPVIKKSPIEILRRYKSKKRFPVLARSLSYEQAQRIEKMAIRGLGLTLRERRFYPNGTLAESVLGEISEDGRGVSGIELSWDARLTGVPQKLRVIRDGTGRMIYINADNSGFLPNPLKLTIDRDVQYIAEDALEGAAKSLKISGGTALIENPKNGEILAMATYPETPLKNPAIQDTYEAGSVLKILTAAAAIEGNVVSPTERIFCENGSYQITPRVTIHDDEPADFLTLSQIIERSSNIGISKVVLRVGMSSFYETMRAFGFLNKTGIRFPAEAAGSWNAFLNRGNLPLASASYGYGVAVTPLQILGAYNVVANGGTLWQPFLIEEESPNRVRRVVSRKTIAILTRFLENVVEKGTGVLAKIPGYPVAGKTGTAHQLDFATKKYSRTKYNATFVGFLPADHPLWTILVVLNNPKGQYYGGQASAPIFAKIARRLIALKGLPPESPMLGLVTK
jgi:cell division protein FtsI (penicillin-binding protein 3)